MTLSARGPWTRGDLVVMAVVLVVMAGGVKACSGCIDALPEFRNVCSPIASVGACDTEGWCGVVLENGTHDTHRYPTLGKQVCWAEPVVPQR